jgi:hypothetical protein
MHEIVAVITVKHRLCLLFTQDMTRNQLKSYMTYENIIVKN